MLKPLRLALFEQKADALLSNILVREAAPSDELAILAIRNNPENYKWFFQNSVVTAEEHSSWFLKRMDESKFFTLVAENVGDVVGVAYLSDFKSGKPKVSINIRPGLKSKGIGSALLTELVIRSKLENLDFLFAEIKSSNLRSIQFFSKNGFTLTNQDSCKQLTIETEVIRLVLNLH